MKGRFHSLDGLRGVSAAAVLFFHTGEFAFPHKIFTHGYLAVDIFFLMSGFVISAAYGEKLLSGLDFGKFLYLRIQRLGPAYWAGTFVGLLCTLPLLLEGNHSGIGLVIPLIAGMAAAFVLIPIGSAHDLAYPINGPAWSLFAEIVINALYAIFIRRLGTWVLLAIIATGLVLSVAYAATNEGGWNFGWKTSQLLPALLRAAPLFAIGVLLQRAQYAGALDFLPSWPSAPLVLGWFFVLMIPAPESLAWDLAIVSMMPLLVAMLVRSEHPSPAWFTAAGAISYPLYASHFSILRLAYEGTVLPQAAKANPLYAIAVIAVALAVAWAIHRWLENLEIPIRLRSGDKQAVG